MENELCRTACSANNLGPLRVNDQLTRERAEERVFASFSEAHIDFLPTYKYDMLTDDYDTSDKQRVPAWTDRVLFRGDVTCTTYQRIDTLRISDHRPVFALLTFNVIDVNRDAEVKVRETILGDLRRELATVVVYCLGDAALAVQDVVRSNLRRVYNALMHACDLCFFLPLLCYGCCLMRSCML
eukprot:m.174297 g.174297  ORF g.174297 m.174297 type:complete len:184 (+) comp16751_c0_seq19:2267-2818(+)